MNKETTQPITVEDLKKRKQDILDEILSLQARLGEVDYWIRQADPSYDRIRKLAATIAFEPLPIMTPAEEAASKERAIRARADELAKGNAALDDAITQVERKNGKPKETYGLTLGPIGDAEYSTLEIDQIWGNQMRKRVSQARIKGKLKAHRSGTSFIFKATDLIAWRDKQGK